MTYDLPHANMAEIRAWQIRDKTGNYDASWIKGVELLRVECKDGTIMIYYLPGLFDTEYPTAPPKYDIEQ